ncbi:insect cuticle protein domain-containing protein [Phthorimaea operculella]|nr:insect cuticle protein domain-containing protein [Phthorimaea operculella]
MILMLLSAAASTPSPEDAAARLISYQNENDGQGNYQFSFELSNGLARVETGRVVNRGEEDEHIQVQGHYKYTDENGEHIIYYTAGKDGFQIVPQGGDDEELPPVTVVSGYPGAVVASFLG